MLGCSGSHKVGDAWGPCESDKDLNKLLELGNPEFREWKKQQGKKAAKLPKGAFTSEAEASKEAIRLGCSGAHMAKQGVWFPCANSEEHNAARAHANVGGSNILRASRPKRRVVTDRSHWEKLRGRGISGIETIPGGGLVSAKSGERGKSDTVTFTAEPTQEMIAASKLGLALRDKHNVGASLKEVLLGKKIVKGEELSNDDVKDMKSFFDYSDSEINYKSGNLSTARRIAWLIHGGNAGCEFARNMSMLMKSDIQRHSESYYEKRFYTGKRRAQYAKRGWALPDGSYPIRDVGDLRNAIQAYGLGKDREAAKRHIMKRAKQLKRTDLIPETWKKGKDK